MFREKFMSSFGIDIYNEMDDASKWNFSDYWVTHIKSGVRFWIANGPMFFHAAPIHPKAKDIKFGFFESRILWKRYMKMIKNREQNFSDLTIDKFRKSIHNDTDEHNIQNDA